MVEIFKALSDSTRMRILALLMQSQLCVCGIECSLKLMQSNASRHLQVLHRAGIIERYRKAQWTYYRTSEIFKEQHALLWQYIEQQLPLLPTYKADLTAFEKCRLSGESCSSKKNPH